MSTSERGKGGGARKWAVPATCVLAAGAYLGVFLATGQVGSALVSAGIMLGYGAVLVAFSRRSEVIAILRDEGRDERRAAVNLRASALTLHVIVVLAIVMAFVQLAEGHGPGAWGTICAVGGGTYIAGTILFARLG